jgi:hypothetical protein
MRIQINSDKQIVTPATAISFYESEIERLLARFASEITRIEIHLSDLDGPKEGVLDKRCAMEVRLKGKNPISVMHVARKVDSSVRGAAQKMQRLLDTTFGRKAATASRKAVSVGTRVGSKSALMKVKRIEALLAEVLEASPESHAHVKAASAAVEKAAKLIGEQPTPAEKTPAKKAGKPKKKMPIFQMRRQAQPRRRS